MGEAPAKVHRLCILAAAVWVKLHSNPSCLMPDDGGYGGVAAIKAGADARAADLAPIIDSIRATGVTSLNGIAAALVERGITTPRGKTTWTATQVGQLLLRLAHATNRMRTH